MSGKIKKNFQIHNWRTFKIWYTKLEEYKKLGQISGGIQKNLGPISGGVHIFDMGFSEKFGIFTGGVYFFVFGTGGVYFWI